MLLIVGTKLQGIITRMCVDSNDKSHVVRGTLLVRPSDHYFWFGRPKLLLHLMHLILFQVIDKDFLSNVFGSTFVHDISIYLMNSALNLNSQTVGNKEKKTELWDFLIEPTNMFPGSTN